MDRLVVLNDSASPRGGATKLAVASAIAARKADVPVTYFTAAGPISPLLTAAGVDVIQIPGAVISAQSRISSALHGTYRLSTFECVRSWIRQNDTPRTVYHLHNWSHFLSPSVFRALSGLAPRLVITLHDFFLSCPNGAQHSYTENRLCSRRALSASCLAHNCDRRGYADKLWRSARHFLRQQLFDLAAERPKLILIHEGMLEPLLIGGIPADCTHVIRNPIEPFAAERIDIRRNKAVLFVGRLTHEKGPDLAVQAAARAGLPTILVGEGPMLAQLRAMPGDNRFAGFCDRKQLAALSRECRLLVMPSRWSEPYGMVAMEALWSGLPVIISQNAYLAPEIARVGAGLSCDTTDIDAFARGLATLADDDAAAERMSLHAFGRTATLGNTMADWEAKHMALYREQLDRSRR